MFLTHCSKHYLKGFTLQPHRYSVPAGRGRDHVEILFQPANRLLSCRSGQDRRADSYQLMLRRVSQVSAGEEAGAKEVGAEEAWE